MDCVKQRGGAATGDACGRSRARRRIARIAAAVRGSRSSSAYTERVDRKLAALPNVGSELGFRLTQHRRELQTWPPGKGPYATSELDIVGVLATVHPSAVLRARSDARAEMYDGLVRDLAQAQQLATA